MQRFIMKMQVTTDPLDPNYSSAHTGGWSESHMVGQDRSIGSASLTNTCTYRAALLPKQAKIVKITLQSMTISKNKLLPGSSQSLAVNFPGNPDYNTDVPQAAISMDIPIQARINTVRIVPACAPDEVIQRGEFTGDFDWRTRAGQYLTNLNNSDAQYGSAVADLSQPQARVLSIAGGVITTDTAGIAVVNDYIRLNRVRTTGGSSVQGVFLVTAVAGAVYTVAGLNVTAADSGSIRKDVLVFGRYGVGKVGRATTRKIGSPFERYRGRRSKR